MERRPENEIVGMPVDEKLKKKGPHNASTKKISSLIFDQSKPRDGMASP